MDSLLAYIIYAVFASAAGAYAAYRRIHRTPNLPDTPVLMSYYTEGNVEVMPLGRGKTSSGLRYTSLGTLGSDSAILMRVELPFRTRIHLLAIPKKTDAVQIDPTFGRSIMERVELEGDFGDYFSLYTEKGMQADARYVLDPKAMAFTMDFCKSHNWEIIRDEFYFVQSTANAEGDPTEMWDDVDQFVSQIRPAVEDKDSPAQASLSTPYGEDRRVNLTCPICSSPLSNEENYFRCPKNDGILINGSRLTSLVQGKLIVEMPTHVAKKPREYDINCPSCGNQMGRVDYNGSVNVIDSCTHCPYRWLDAGELMRAKQAL